MVASSVLFSATAFAAVAVAGSPSWELPKPTGVEGMDGQVRTDFLASMPEPTSPAELPYGIDLKKRQAPPPYLCGYVTGDADNSVYCSSTRTCVFNTAYRAQACCIQNSLLPGTQYTACNFYSSCKPYTSLGALSGSASFDLGVTSCNSLYPSCFTYSYTDIGFVNYGCSTRSYSSAVQLSYSGQTLGTSRAPITDTARPTQVTGLTTGRLTGSTQDGAPVQTIFATQSTGGGGSGGTRKKSNVGAIAGGVVAGVAGIAIIIAAVVFLLARNSKKKKAAAAGAAPAMQQGYNGGMGPPPLHPGSTGPQNSVQTGGYYPQQGYPQQQPGVDQYGQQQPVQPQYSGGMGQPQPSYYGQDQKSIPGFGDQTTTTPSQSYNPSMSPQNTGMSEAPANPAQHTGGSGTAPVAHGVSGTNAGPTPIFEIGAK